MPSQEFASHTGLYIVQVNLKVDVYNYNANAHKINDWLKALRLTHQWPYTAKARFH